MVRFGKVDVAAAESPILGDQCHMMYTRKGPKRKIPGALISLIKH
jgi:hypothetical protein